MCSGLCDRYRGSADWPLSVSKRVGVLTGEYPVVLTALEVALRYALVVSSVQANV